MDANQRKDSQGLNSQPYATATCRHAWWMRPYTQTFTPAATYVLARNKRLYPRRPCMLKCTFVNSMGASWKTDYQSNCRVLVDPSSPILIERTTMKHRSWSMSISDRTCAWQRRDFFPFDLIVIVVALSSGNNGDGFTRSIKNRHDRTRRLVKRGATRSELISCWSHQLLLTLPTIGSSDPQLDLDFI